MVDEKTSATTTSTQDTAKTVARQLSGTSFLTLEHVAYFVLVVVLPSLLLLGASTALNLWQNGSSGASGSSILPLNYSMQAITQFVDTTVAISLVAAFLVLVPLMFVLRRRTAAEYVKRPGYTGRVGYKLPIYSALAVLGAQMTGAFVSMLGVFLNSLANIGVKGANIGDMYVEQFLPAMLAFLIFGVAAWYVISFAKGRDMSRMFVGSVALLAGVLSIALFVTTLTLNHEAKSTDPIRQNLPYDIEEDYFRY